MPKESLDHAVDHGDLKRPEPLLEGLELLPLFCGHVRKLIDLRQEPRDLLLDLGKFLLRVRFFSCRHYFPSRFGSPCSRPKSLSIAWNDRASSNASGFP